MIEVSGVSKRYGQFLAVQDLNFKIQPGEVVGFLGPNGAGKTTTMKMLTGFMGPSSGTITIDGLDVFSNPVEAKKRIGYLPESPPVYLEMRVEEYLKFVAELKLVPKAKIKERVEEVMEQMGLLEIRRKLIQFLSKGFRQRVGIAQALISEPKILILDEPTVGLDPKQVIEIRELIRSLKGKHTIILSTHILPEVQALCERIIVISQGRIVAQDSISRLTDQVLGSRRIRVVVKRNGHSLASDLKTYAGVRDVQLKPGAQEMEILIEGGDEIQENLASKVAASGCGLLAFEPSAGLEDLFLKLTSNGVGQEVSL